MTVDTPEAAPTHERLESMREEIEELRKALTDTREENARIKQRLAALESDGPVQTGDYPAWADRYDKPVLDRLAPGTEASVQALRNAYRDAGIRNSDTLADRVGDLIRRAEFERVGKRLYEFQGVGN